MAESFPHLRQQGGSPRGKPVPLKQVIPNRLNPNEMDWGLRTSLREEMENDTYDPIVISPADVFYGDEAQRMELIVTFNDGVQLKVDHADAYIICDGRHRYEEALNAGMIKIRSLICQMTEEEAMPWFYKRHRIRGNLNPLKEAELFWYERNVRGLSRDEIIKRYGLSGVGYLKTRLKLTNLAVSVTKLFYEPPKGAKGKLTIGDLREIATLPGKLQKIVSVTALERNWTSRDIEAECTRVKSMKGILSPQAYVPPLASPPPTRAEKQQRGKKWGRTGRPDKEMEPPAPDAEVFKEYSPDVLKHVDEPADSLKDALRDAAATQGTTQGHMTYEPKVTTPPDSWKMGDQELPREAIEEPKPLMEISPQEKISPPLIIDRNLMEPFIAEVLIVASREGLNLNAETIDNKPILQNLREKIDEELYLLLDRGRLDALPRIALRASQIWILEAQKNE